ncbi:Co-chaperone protein DjlA [subsurface metagenome]
MARRKGKSKQEHTFGVVLDFVDLVDTTFERLTGKTIASWLKEFQQQPRELPGREQAAPQQEQGMPLADAYAVLGLPQTASLEEVKRNYNRLSFIFHPDKGGYEEAQKLLNRAYEAIQRRRGGSH